MLIGEQIRALRSQKKITQEILAAEMGVTVGAVSKWESGTTLPDGTQLRGIFGTTPPDILFLDIHLGEENGLELLKELKEKYSNTRIVMVTADNAEKTIQTAISYKADAFVTKPFMPQHILTALIS